MMPMKMIFYGKIRYDIWCWNEKLSKKRKNYEMAQQAKVATNIIADMITFLS